MELLPTKFAIARSGCEITVRGELDLAVESELTAAIGEALAVPGPALVLDLHGVVFMDSCGIRCLIHAELACREHGRRLLLAHPSSAVMRPLEVTGIVDRFLIADESPETIAAVAA